MGKKQNKTRNNRNSKNGVVKKKQNKHKAERKSKQLHSSSHHTNNSNSHNNASVDPLKRLKHKILKKQKKERHSKASYSNASNNSKTQKGSVLMDTLSEKLVGAKFRMLNEQLYASTGQQAQQLFEQNPELFKEYHDGFRKSLEQWSFDPVSNLISWLNKKPKKLVVADFGCGEARIAKEAKQTTIHSFDLVATSEHVTACDIAHVPLEDESVDIGIFSLSLMGTNFIDYLKEAYRVLKKDGTLKIVELESRFTKFEPFKKLLQRLGFDLKSQLNPDNYFVIFEFQKNAQRKCANVDNANPLTILKPCLYKNR